MSLILQLLSFQHLSFQSHPITCWKSDVLIGSGRRSDKLDHFLNPTKTLKLHFFETSFSSSNLTTMAKSHAAGLFSAITATISASRFSQTTFSDGAIPSSSSSSETESSSKTRNNHPRTTSSGFDPEALERGVKALKDISSSSHAKKVSLHFYLPFFFFLNSFVSC